MPAMNATLRAYCICLILIGKTMSAGAAEPKVSPATVIKITFEAANAGHYDEAEKHLTAKALAQMNGMLAKLAGGHIKLWDGWTKGRTLEKIEILKESIDGAKANVRYRFHYKDGTSKDDDDDLLLENGEWKFLP